LQLVKRSLDETKVDVLADTVGGRDPFFSPDGQWIGFLSADGHLKRVAVSGGSAFNVADAASFRGGAWAEDGTIVFTPNLTGGLSRVAATGGTAVVLTTRGGLATDRWPQVLPGGKTVLFTSSSDTARIADTANIDVVTLETGARKTVIRGGYFGRYVAGPQGGHILYVDQGTLFAAPFDAEALELRGTAVPVVDGMASDPSQGSAHFALSTDPSQSTTLVYATGGGANVSYPISWLNSAGKTSPLVAQPGRYGVPRFSPDGKRLLYSAPGGKGIDQWVHDVERDTSTQLTFTGPGNFEGVWSPPDGKYVVYSSGTKLWWLRADGAGQPKLLREAKGIMRPNSFTPDGKRLFYMQATPDVDIWSMALDLTEPENPKPGKAEAFQQTSVIEVDAAVSPDGRWVAYASIESGPPEVYVRPISGSGKWKVSAEGGKYPLWSRTANQLFFLAPDDRIMVTDWTAQGDSFNPGRPRVWSETRILRTAVFPSFALHPDGKRFAVFPQAQEPENPGSLHATFLLNFGDELLRRAPVGK
jgi:serine/threonine-protein kinase